MVNPIKHANSVVSSMWNADLDFWPQGGTRTLTALFTPIVYPVSLVTALFKKKGTPEES